jgi:hypothetical protein
VQKNDDIHLYTGWVNASDYRGTDESFVTVTLHSNELHKALIDHAEHISEDVKANYSGSLEFLCDLMGVQVPFLPVDGLDEYRLFT